MSEAAATEKSELGPGEGQAPVVTADDKGKDATEGKEAAAVDQEPLLGKTLVRAKPLVMSRFVLAEEVRHVWRVTCEQDTTPAQCLDEGFWANVGSLLRPGDEIQILPDNYAWRLDLHVSGAGRLFAHVVQMAFYDLKPATPIVKLPSIYKVEFAGAHHKWRILREGKMLKDGFETEALARRAAANHEAAVQR